MTRVLRLALLTSAGLATACAQATVTIFPTAVSVHLGTYFQFADKITGVSPTTAGWKVALPAGAAGSPGSISPGGRYTPPATMPGSGTVIVTVSSTVTPTATATATVTLLNPYPAVASVKPANVAPGPYTLTINGSGFIDGAVVELGGAPLATTYVSATQLTATGAATGAQKGLRFPVTVLNPNPGAETSTDVVSVEIGSTDGPPTISYSAAARFLDQAAWGGDAATIAHVQSAGFINYLGEQFNAPISPYPDPSTTGFDLRQVQARFFTNAVHGQDQLRQRVAFALGEQFVVSGIDEKTPTQLVPYLQILQKDAFGNFRQLMEDVTLSPTMGEYLNMLNNDKANPATGTRANENYARELMQLFTIGLFQLNLDGTSQTDASGHPIPTYDQTTIQNFAKVYTGWTYPTKPGATLRMHNPLYFIGPMVADESNHDTTGKTLLNGLIDPAGLTAEQDLKVALDNIFSHPNVAPFVSKQLIEHLVTSNPSPAYVARVAAVFNNDGGGVRGNLAAVVMAILLDPEARAGDDNPLPAPATGGHLREPVFFVSSMLRGLGATVNDTNYLTALAANLGQTLFYPPSVFNYFGPGYLISPQFTNGALLKGPEFQLNSPSNAVTRYNTVTSVVYGNLGAGTVVDLTPFASLGNDQTALFAAVGNAFFDGQMPAAMQTLIQGATNAVTGTNAAAMQARAQAALYLGLSSGYYNVEH
ncbi:MAG TPA: DUF1800 domain-containing protein [Bryobacteraceae bacterium]|nr:DUF1800 domain-containing protein [Bryobacteraceae bacterium]